MPNGELKPLRPSSQVPPRRCPPAVSPSAPSFRENGDSWNSSLRMRALPAKHRAGQAGTTGIESEDETGPPTERAGHYLVGCITYMRILILILLLSCVAHADTVITNDPTVFDSTAAMKKWADSAWGGYGMRELTYHNQKLVIYFRSHTSGIVTSEPFVFVERAGRWIRVLTAMTCSFEMDATIEGDALVLWRLSRDKKKEKTEYLRFNLANLNAA